MDQSCDVVVIGAGASGLLCAGLLAEQNLEVILLEKNEKVGRKLAATGNGRCNFTNRNMDVSHYYGDSAWIESVLSAWKVDEIVRQFESMGVYHRERDGYLYPYTNQAVTVVNALQSFCLDNGVKLYTGCKVTSIQRGKQKYRYRVRTSNGVVDATYLVLATGGTANEPLGADGSGYKLAKGLGHHVTPIYPGLTGLICKGNWWKKVAGTRVLGRFSLNLDGKEIAGECGEIQITREGVSGIPVFQLSRVVAEALDQGKRVEGVIDFIPGMTSEQLSEWMDEYGIQGIVPLKWVPVLSGRELNASLLKRFSFEVTDTMGMERAQVSAGGVYLDEVSAQTMESKKAEDVFLIGEILDADGMCGGYNLHFAWCTALTAAMSICDTYYED